jgi:hypothetical protein
LNLGSEAKLSGKASTGESAVKWNVGTPLAMKILLRARLRGTISIRADYFPAIGRNVMARKYSKKASAKVERAMKKRKAGTLKSGRSGKKVTSRKQAIAIGLSEARAEGKKVPKKAAKKKKAVKKRKSKK